MLLMTPVLYQIQQPKLYILWLGTDIATSGSTKKLLIVMPDNWFGVVVKCFTVLGSIDNGSASYI